MDKLMVVVMTSYNKLIDFKNISKVFADPLRAIQYLEKRGAKKFNVSRYGLPTYETDLHMFTLKLMEVE